MSLEIEMFKLASEDRHIFIFKAVL